MDDELSDYLHSPEALAATAAAGDGLFRPGERFAGLRIVAFLGRGRQGETWKVRDENINADFALKVFRPAPDAAADGEAGGADADAERARARFVAEARCLAQISHPNVVRVHRLERDGAAPWFTMDLLRPMVAPLPRRKVRKVVSDVLDALAALHAKGVIHRDVKPSNILFDADGNAVVADFGIARVDGAETAEAVSDGLDAAATFADGVVRVAGTPAFGAPEQFVGDDIGPETDIHAVGRLALHLFDGRAPLAWRWFILRSTNSSPQLRYASAKAAKRALAWVRALEALPIAALAAAALIALAVLRPAPRHAAAEDAAEAQERTLLGSDVSSPIAEIEYPFLPRTLHRRVTTITLKDGATYALPAHMEGRLLGTRSWYVLDADGDHLAATNRVRLREPIVVEGSGTLVAPEIAYADVRLKRGVTLVTSGRCPWLTPPEPPPDADLTNHTEYASFAVERGARLVFTANPAYPPSLVR